MNIALRVSHGQRLVLTFTLVGILQCLWAVSATAQQVALGNAVWKDANNDGNYDSGEGAAAAVVELWDANTNTFVPTGPDGDPGTLADNGADFLTDSNGCYLFVNLPEGTYYVKIPASEFAPGEPLYGYYSITGTQSGDDDSGEDGIDDTAPTTNGIRSANVVLADNGAPASEAGKDNANPVNQADDDNTDLTVDFGFVRPGRLGNLVWLDENSNGLQDEGERGVPHATVSIYNAAGALVTSTRTDASGGWAAAVPGGDYFAEATLPAGLTQSPLTSAGADFGNQDQSTGAGDYGYPMSVGPGGENLTGDFGFNYNPNTDVTGDTGTAALGDRVWIDVDNDGAQDPDEAGLYGVELTLCIAGLDGRFGTADDVAAATATTNAAGHYIFDGLEPGAYVVKVTGGIPPGLGYDQRGDPDHFGVAAGVNDERTTVPVVLGPGDVFLNVDFGYQADVSNCVGNFVWLDSNANGVQNTGEEGIPGVSVALIADTDGNGVWDPVESIIATDVTDSSGFYHFRGLPDGKYLIWVNDTDNVLARLLQTYDFDGIATPDISAVDLDSAETNPAPVLIYDHDFGYTPDGQTDTTGAIGDYVWLDANRDGVQDSTESGIEGVIMGLYDSAGTTLLATTATNENGRYWFGSLDPSETYVIKVELANTDPGGALEGMTGTWDADSGLTPDAMSSADLGALPDGNNDTDGINNDVNPGQDFGYAAPLGSDGTIGNLVWLDQNADGISQGVNGPDGLGGTDDDEPGISGVTLDLYRDLNGNGVVDPGEPIVGSTVTGLNGAYLFSGLPSDTYVVDVTDAGGKLFGYWHSRGEDGFNNNSQADTYPAEITGGSPDNLTADFGYYVEPAAAGNRVWVDVDRNGLQNPGDTALPGVEVTLTITWPDESTTILKTLSDSTGHYSFGNLLLDENHRLGGIGPGEPSFTISIESPQTVLTGYTATIEDIGGNDYIDSDSAAGVQAFPVQGLTNVAAQSPPSAENAIASYDFGYLIDKATTFAAWQAVNPLGGQNQATGNPDGDRYVNFLEYALCLPPGSGVNEPVCLQQTGAASAAFLYTRAQGLSDVTYEVETTSTLGSPTAWSAVVSSPLISNNGNGTETLFYANIVPPGSAGNTSAFYRVVVTDTVNNQVYYSEIQGWLRHDIVTGCETFSCPLLPKAAATGAIGTVSGQVLDLTASLGGVDLTSLLAGGNSYYLEVTGGDNTGHRFDITGGSATSVTLANDSDLCAAAAPYNTLAGAAPASLAGDSFAIYAHRTVEGMFPRNDYQAGTGVNTSDRILIKRGSAWDIYWLYADGVSTYWDLDGDGGFSDEGGDVIPPHQGLFVHKASALTLEHLCVGEVRTWNYCAPLCETDGCTLTAPGYPLDQSPDDLNILLSDGWNGGPGPLGADKILIWNGDSGADIGYTCYWLADAGAPWQYWTADGDSLLPDIDGVKIFKRSRSAFLKPELARPGWCQTPPFTP